MLSITSAVKIDFCLESETISNISLTCYSYFMLDYCSVNSNSMELLQLWLTLKVNKWSRVNHARGKWGSKRRGYNQKIAPFQYLKISQII